MFNAKWGFICGGAAFALAFVVSLSLGHTSLLVALIRAAGFAALFFGLGTGIWALINIFIPELLTAAQNNAVGNVFSRGATGSRVNITLDDTSDAALPGALPDVGAEAADADEVGDFKDLLSRSTKSRRDIDQNPPTGYTEEREQEEFTPAFDNPVGVSLDSSPDNVKIEGLGDFSMDFGAFVPESGKTANSDPFMDPFSFLSGTGDSVSTEEIPPPPRKSSTRETAQLQGDFDPKEIAAGIRTVLEKDKKG